ncbi:hypothetical protein LRY65_00430 [Candidatus Woesebacteria bacterium]|nr:hypothetical protein [Candidatus Woesebacteria bacterium]MCD8526668.1 hypothetical protein [Candidatus Woesebacteria bacterium]MCD8546693.1 hypothetical protein [Candidatus Woesebacteria bacterium]
MSTTPPSYSTNSIQDILRIVGHTPEEVHDLSLQLWVQIVELASSLFLTELTIDPLPFDISQAIEDSRALSPEEMNRKYRSHFSIEDLEKNIQQSTQMVMELYFKNVYADLSDEQKQQLRNYFSEEQER